MHLLFLASGSGGHVYPCLSLIKKALPKHKITYLTIKNGFEEKVIDNLKNVNVLSIDVPNQLKKYLKKPVNFFKLKKALNNIRNDLKSIDAIITFGGFVTFIGLLISFKLKKPIYIHEQNSVIGDANMLGQFFAKKVFTSMDKTKHILFPKKTYNFGNPRMDEVSSLPYFYQNNKSYNVLFFAGSLSSSSLNKIIKEVIKKGTNNNIHLFVISGNKNYENLKNLENEHVTIIKYEKNMITLMQKMDFIIMRAGATSISEIISLNKLSLLIPSPNVKHNHQYLNAKYLFDKKAAFMIEEKDVSSDEIIMLIDEVKNNYDLQIEMKSNLNKLKKENVCENILLKIQNE